ncbi:histidine phosphatase family protein [Halocatena pleomorpha]|uniref:Histidine phosphatase family protein n=1 Tax=Halocatena pleomorpha TaxID=1785090 RepID=A0A3P3RAF1_9EURY|nr:histidine phosphatase family protein [Halocatena pleomorpha]RRJ30461.1 histidine phosphatase family protein [Halocatena pleomorpha]
MTTVMLLRHGETTWNLDGRLQGWAPVRLNDQGREQATATGAYFSRADTATPDRVVSSDLSRTKETTELLRSTIDVPVRFETAWRERDLGVYQGLSLSTVADRFPAFGLGTQAAHASDRTPEGGESFVHLQDRVLTGWEELLEASESDECVLVVTHGGPIQVVLGHIRDVPLEQALIDEAPINCSFAEITVPDGTDTDPSVVRTNVVPWTDA